MDGDGRSHSSRGGGETSSSCPGTSSTRYSPRNMLRRNSCTALLQQTPAPQSAAAESHARMQQRFAKMRRMSFTENAPHQPTATSPAEGSESGSSSSSTPDPSSLRVSTILRRWNSHRERRLSDSKDGGSTPRQSRKLSAW